MIKRKVTTQKIISCRGKVIAHAVSTIETDVNQPITEQTVFVRATANNEHSYSKSFSCSRNKIN